ncbi:hypothetical protein [Streptomyces venetus]|uniref:hypothetical protein n=1 Tax=Streptomyces venetus TaxID=1701086 RepID=UPI0031EB45F5
MPSSSKNVTPDAPARVPVPSPGVALAWLLFIAYLATVITVAVLGEPMQWMVPALGVLPLAAGVLLVVGMIRELRKWVSLRRHGVTVTAVWSGYKSKKRRFVFADAEGTQHEFLSRHHLAAEIQVTYDPRDPRRTYSPMPLLPRVIETVGGVIFTGVFLALGIALVPVQLFLVLFG